MTETISRSASTPENTLEPSVDEKPLVNLEQDRSFIGSSIEQAASRLNSSLVRRNRQKRVKNEQTEAYASYEDNIATTIDREQAIADSHSEALDEYRESDYSDYVDHLDKLASQADLPTGTKYDLDQQESQRQFGQESLSHERKLADRQDRHDARQELYSSALTRLRGFGRAAVNALRTTGYGIRAAAEVGGSAIARGAVDNVRRFNDYTYTPNVAMELQQHHQRQKKLRKDRVAEVKAERKASIPTFADRMARYRDNATEKATVALERKAERRQDKAYASYGGNIATTLDREARDKQDEAYDSYKSNVKTTRTRERAERHKQDKVFNSYRHNIAVAEQNDAYDSYEDNRAAAAKRQEKERRRRERAAKIQRRMGAIAAARDAYRNHDSANKNNSDYQI